MSDKIRVGLWHNMVSPYRIPVFELLAREPGIDLEVLFGETRAKDRCWNVEDVGKYKYQILPGKRFPKIPFVYNPTLRSVLKERAYDVIYAWDAYEFGSQIAYLYAKRTGTPFVLWSLHCDFVDMMTGTGLWDIAMFLPRRLKKAALFWNKMLADRIKRTSDRYVSSSLSATKHLVRKGAPLERIVQIRNPVDNETYVSHLNYLRAEGVPGKLRESNGWLGKKVVLALSYIRRAKGLEILIEAFARMGGSDRVLAIVGDGPYRAYLQEMVRSRSLQNIEFHPYTHDPGQYYLACDVAVLPPIAGECWGLTTNECLLAGKPMILSSNVGSKEVLPDQRLVVPPGDVDALRAALELVLSDDKLRESHQTTGPKVIQEKCSIEQAVNGMSEAIRQAYAEKRAGTMMQR